MSKPIICLDFDGVLHSYTSGWKGADVVSDPVVPGAIEWMREACKHFDLRIYSSRSHQPGGRAAMMGAIARWNDETPGDGSELKWSCAVDKPPAFVTIDDRAITFMGTFPTIDALKSFKPWNKQ